VPLEKIKKAIKSVPFLYNALCPTVMSYKYQKESKRLRLYCTQVPSIVAQPVFVKVGANDGVTGDPISDILLANEKWKGVLIEPVPFLFQRLRQNFGDHQRFALEQVAIGAKSGTASFYYVDERAIKSIPNLPEWYDQLGSFDRSHITRQLGGAIEPFILECIVDLRPLAEVLKKRGIGDVHLLHIDAEGHDFEVLKTADLVQEPPAAILLEHKHLSGTDRAAMLKHLRKHNYLVDDCCGDFFAVHKKSPLSNLAKDRALQAGSY
jgi:FkbM family methyltransferase